VDLGMLKKSGLIHYYFRRKEKKLYAKADHIGCMSQGNIDFVKKHNPSVSSDKLHMLSNWGDLIPLASQEQINNLRKQEGLENKFVILFGGNIGLPQKMENIVDLAISCENKKDILFLIIGGGNEEGSLKKLIEEKNLQNMQLKNGLPQKEYLNWVQMADVGLISLSEKFTIPNIPSKVLSYYNTKTPILASIDKNTDFGNILDELNVGVWAEAGNTSALKEKLMLLYDNSELRKKMGENGYVYMKDHLSSEIALKIVLKQTKLG